MTTSRNSERERTACEKTPDNRLPRWLTPARDDDGKSVIGTTEVVPFPISRNVVFFRSLRSRALAETTPNGNLSAACEVVPFPETAPNRSLSAACEVVPPFPETAPNGSLSAACEVAPFPEATPMGDFCAAASTRCGKRGNLFPSPRQPRAAVPTCFPNAKRRAAIPMWFAAGQAGAVPTWSVIAPCAPAAHAVAWGGPAKQSLCLQDIARPWARRRRTCSGCQWWASGWPQ